MIKNRNEFMNRMKQCLKDIEEKEITNKFFIISEQSMDKPIKMKINWNEYRKSYGFLLGKSIGKTYIYKNCGCE
jgi:hypothetical protein